VPTTIVSKVAARVVVATLLLGGRTALAAEDSAGEPPGVALSTGVGVGLALLPMVAGGAAVTRSQTIGGRRRAVQLIALGVGTAPVASHLIAGEWSRAAAFGAVSLSAAALVVGVLERSPGVVSDTKRPAGALLVVGLAVEIFAAGAGLMDSLTAGERRGGRVRLRVLPGMGQRALALAVAGAL
jgi:hypothetical protein